MAILLALVSMTCAAGTDLVYRHRALHAGALQLVLVGVLWTAMAIGGGGRIFLSTPGLGWALLGGACGCASHALLQQALRAGGIAVCATIYRMHVVPACLAGMWLLGEQMTLPIVLALAASVLAILLVCADAGRASPGAVATALIATLLRAGMTLGMAAALKAGAAAQALLVGTGLAWLTSGLVLLLATATVRARQHARQPVAPGAARPETTEIGWQRLGWGCLAGVLVAGNVTALAHALTYGSVTTVLPIAQCNLPLTALLAWLLLAEPLTARRWAGVGCASLSITLLSTR